MDVKYPKWKESNLGYLKGERVSYRNKNYEAIRSLGPTQKFNSKHWKLVEKD
jgi:hypothetical protein